MQENSQSQQDNIEQHDSFTKQFEAFNAAVEKDYPWNNFVSITDGAFFSLGMGFTSLNTILTLFVRNLTTSNILLSFATIIAMLGSYLPQIFIANYTETVKWKKPLTAYFGIFQRLPWLIMAILTYSLQGISSSWLLVTFFFLYAMYSIASGLTTPPWYDLTAKIIPADRLGRYFGLRNFAGGILEFTGASIAGVILKNLGFPTNFIVLFGLTFITLTVSLFFFLSIKEPDYPVVKKAVRLSEYLGSLPEILRKNKNFRLYIIGLIFLQFYVMGNVLYTASAIVSLHLSKVQQGLQVGMFTAIMLGCQALFFLIWGNLSDRLGHRQIILISAVLNIMAASLAAIGTHLYLYYIIFACVGISQAASRISLLAIIPEFCSPEERPTYVGLANSIPGLANIIAAAMCGVLADIFNYRVVFLLAVALILIGVWILLKHVKDPRKPNNVAQEA